MPQCRIIEGRTAGRSSSITAKNIEVAAAGSPVVSAVRGQAGENIEVRFGILRGVAAVITLGARPTQRLGITQVHQGNADRREQIVVNLVDEAINAVIADILVQRLSQM